MTRSIRLWKPGRLSALVALSLSTYSSMTTAPRASALLRQGITLGGQGVALRVAVPNGLLLGADPDVDDGSLELAGVSRCTYELTTDATVRSWTQRSAGL